MGGELQKGNDSVHGSYVRKPDLLTAIFDYSNLRKILPNDNVHKKHYYLNEKYPKVAKECDAISGAFMLTRKEVFEKIGLFDENFFMYLEDVDFCIRAKKKRYKIMFCPKSKMFHIGGASSPNKDKINHLAWKESRKYYAKKHFNYLENLLIQIVYLFDNLIINILKSLK